MGIHHCPMDARLDEDADRKIKAFHDALDKHGVGEEVDWVRFEHESCVFFIKTAEHVAELGLVAWGEAGRHFPQFQDLDAKDSDVEFGVDFICPGDEGLPGEPVPR